MSPGLPAPAAGRWKPLRLGLVDLYLYDAQEFRFRDGRLLVRGDNGAGKSKVLALTLPLLLDANLASQRVEPDADRGKRMAWNLLQGGEYDSRTGYSWIEFGRIDEEGVARFTTLGLGMRAVAGRDQVPHWWFSTDLRVGDGFHLVDVTKTVLTKDRLAAALGDDGIVFETAEAYRRDVDRRLFRLGEQRYGALVDLLVHLRQPQLSKRPDEAALAAALREALPPLGQDVVDDVAQAFQSLEEDRRQLEDLRQSAGAVRAFIGEYANYARVAAARAADALQSVQRAVDRAQRGLRDATAAHETAVLALQQSREAVGAAADEATRVRARVDELRDLRSSDAYLQFEQLGREVAAAERESAAADREARDAAAAADRAGATLTSTRAEGAAALDRRATASADATAAATAAGIDVRTAVDAADEAAIHAEARRRTTQVDTVRARLGERDAAGAALASARRRLDEAETALAGALELDRAARDTAAAAGRDWVEASRAALLAAAELRTDDDAVLSVIDRAAAWAEDPEGENPLAVWAAGVQHDRSAALVEARTVAGAARDGARTAIRALEQERRALEAHGTIAPPMPYTRTADRADVGGVPFWRCVDFAHGIDDARRAGLEAALEAAGLLDAWIAEAGDLRLPGDVVLDSAPVPGPTLSDVLVPAAGATIGTDRIRGVLSSVALGVDDGRGVVAVADDGRFVAGPAHGSWSKPEAVYIGEVARERARRARLAAIATEQVEVTAQVESAERTIAALGDRLQLLAREFRTLPADVAVRTGAARSADASGAAAHATTVVVEAAEQCAAAELAALGAQQHLDATAAELRLPTAADALAAIDVALRELGWAARRLTELAAAATAAQHRADAAGQTASDADDLLARRRDEQEQRRVVLLTVRERRATAEQAVGAEVRELDEQLRAATAALQAAEAAVQEARTRELAASRTEGVAQGRADDAAQATDAAVAERQTATDTFRDFASTGLLRVLDPELEVPDPSTPWAPDPAVRLARRVETRESDLRPESWDRAQNRLQSAFEALGAALTVRGRNPYRDTRHGIAVVLVEIGPRTVAPDVLLGELEQEVADRERLLTAQEREVLENHLLDEVASTVQALMREADGQVAAMNRELESRPTSSGLRIRIGWRPVEDTGLDRARRRLLLQTAAAWSPADRAAIGDFLQQRIETERAADPEATWHDRLTVALDYRNWNRFVVELHQNGSWRPASGPASGGERVLAASVPLFAAASAHYGSAAPHAPRLILLDEAFAGVDDRSRASYLGLLATFDLDVVMTSEREWAAYPEVPGIAIANLSRMGDLKAVHVDHWEWDGRARTRVADPGQTVVAARPAPRGEAALDLFGETV